MVYLYPDEGHAQAIAEKASARRQVPFFSDETYALGTTRQDVPVSDSLVDGFGLRSTPDAQQDSVGIPPSHDIVWRNGRVIFVLHAISIGPNLEEQAQALEATAPFEALDALAQMIDERAAQQI